MRISDWSSDVCSSDLRWIGGMAEALDLDLGDPLGTHRPHVLNALLKWAETALDHRFANEDLLLHALTHSSHSQPDYQRLEFLGDRVLGLVMARWLYERFPAEIGRAHV